MPGTGILDFGTHARAIANAGIYDFAVHHDQILVPVVLRHWGVESLEGLDAEAEEARASDAEVHRAGRQGRQAPRLAQRASPPSVRPVLNAVAAARQCTLAVRPLAARSLASRP